jgi:hypothetical protein
VDFVFFFFFCKSSTELQPVPVVVDGTIFQDFSREKYSCSFREFRTTGFTVDTRTSSKQFITLVDLKSFNPENSSEYAIFGSEKHKEFLRKEAEGI